MIEIYKKISFKNHINLAKKYDLPLIVHTRDADIDTIDILKKEFKKKPFKGLIHCFTASEEFAKEVLKIGFLYFYIWNNYL